MRTMINNHRLIIRFLIFWHLVIAVFALILYVARLENRQLAGDLILDYSEIANVDSLGESIAWHGINTSLILVAAVAIASFIFLVVKKTWGRVSSIILGAILLALGIYFFINNFWFTFEPNPSFIERLIDYFSFMGASLNYIDLVCIFYGTFAIIYFTRRNVNDYLKLQSDLKKQVNSRYSDYPD